MKIVSQENYGKHSNKLVMSKNWF